MRRENKYLSCGFGSFGFGILLCTVRDKRIELEGKFVIHVFHLLQILD